MFFEDEIGVPIGLLNFSYKLFVRKYVPDIVLHKILHLDEPNLAAGEDVLGVSPMYGLVKRHI